MKAWHLIGPNEFGIKEIKEPSLKKGFVKVEILTVQPSITETIMVLCEGDALGITDRIKSGKILRLPGHEFCGRVIEVNKGSQFKPGDRVSSLAKIPCGKCHMCLSGKIRHCLKEDLLGVTIDGVFCEVALLPESGLVKVPDGLSNSEAANLQPLADCIAAVDSTLIKLGDTVAIYGAGCLGMNTMQVLRASGAGTLIVVDVKKHNLELAKKLGAQYVINGAKENPVKIINELTHGIGADIVFEAAGGNPRKGLAGTSALSQAINSLKPEGQLVILAMYGPEITFPIGNLRTLGKKVIMPIFTSLKHMEHGANSILSGNVQIKPLVASHLYGIDKVPEAFEITSNKAATKSISPAQVHIKE